ncbi:hypothetical protein G6F70_004704 [Rhizopus microsporus]|uniref:Yeast cell wall synthesis Kre9/Knh1-like N-terminal domain-containing protein n=2 Tax=Rhizopus TaxID=4842 RepID=A0A367K3L3_RHIAZ|nr:hypothetical protein G6F71_004736 [Rhizopus microsporus]KAG1199685.1 hypothetical protein G6F70_004704 [Rhizopus microsporus]KAG1211427.1 hypothetical protein G6F69_004601 [Rhizopus microsporus]ORE21221.1 hypothetical protein BCV71DRAFT_288994 [Rhizopus microsporus]RCH96725.1 hypothetical protein CU097_011186 [Rhizopus azygosporus]
MKLAALLASAAYLASFVSAQTAIVSITSPLANARVKAGTEVIISWVNPKVPTISQIVLAKGPATALQPLMTIATNVNANDMKYVWKVPKELPEGNDYAFELGTSPDIAFTGAFTIEGGTGGPLPAQSSSDSSPSANSAPASSSSSSPANSNTNKSGAVATPASVSSSSTSSQTSQGAGASHASSASQNSNPVQVMVAVGLAAIVAAQHLL